MRYTSLSLVEVREGLDGVAHEAHEVFGRITVRQLNWRPDASRWSVAQCFQDLLTANELMLTSAKDALENRPRTLWQRAPLVPMVFGWVMIRSQAPETKKKFTAPEKARPTSSNLPG